MVAHTVPAEVLTVEGTISHDEVLVLYLASVSLVASPPAALTSAEVYLTQMVTSAPSVPVAGEVVMEK